MAQKPIFPMKYVNLSQKEFGNFSHQGSTAIDMTGRNAGIESAFAPCDCKVVKKNGTNVIFESLAPVETAYLGVMHIHFRMYHDNNTNDLWVGKTFKQFDKIYDEGTAGYATGNHIDMIVARGKFGQEIQNAQGVWTLAGQAYSTEIFWFNDNTVEINTLGNKYKRYSKGIVIGETFDVWRFIDRNGDERYALSVDHTFAGFIEQTSPVANRNRYFRVELNPKNKFFETKKLTNKPEHENQIDGSVLAQHSHAVRFNGTGWDVL